MMSGTIAEVHWFPSHGDRFLTWGSDINLYELRAADSVDPTIVTSELPVDDGADDTTASLLTMRCVNDLILADINLNISDATTAVLQAAESRYQYVRCVAPSYRRSGELVVAVGLTTGKVGLCKFVTRTENNLEFTPKQQRPVTALAWHELDTNVLAIGHDRNRSDHCITIWDTELGLAKDRAITNTIGLSETAHSLCWDRQARVLFAGMSLKQLKIMDLRHSSPVVNAIPTRAVHGLAQSPNGRLITSFVDNLVTLWDLRSMDKPVAVHAMEKNVSALSWCTTRPSSLAIVQRDVAHIQLLELHGSGNEHVLHEPFSVKRIIAPFQKRATTSTNMAPAAQLGVGEAPPAPAVPALAYHDGLIRRGITLSGISWHPTSVERMLALSGSGRIVDFTIQPRVAVAFDNANNLNGSLDMNMKRLRRSQTQRRVALERAEKAAVEAATAAAKAAEPTVQQLAGGVQQLKIDPAVEAEAEAAAQAAAAAAAEVEAPDEAIEVAGEWQTEEDRDQPDIMDLIRRRAKNEYGRTHNMLRNGDLAENAALEPVWKFVAECGNNGGRAEDTFAGLCEILGISSGRDTAPMYGSDTKQQYWSEYPLAPPVKVFRNLPRLAAQTLCGWTFDTVKPADSLRAFCLDLGTRGEYTRAAMIASMQQQIGLAIDMLQLAADQQPDSHLQMAAMALSGLTFEKDTKWRAQCRQVRTQLSDAHLRAMFAFLTPDADAAFDSILHETAIAVGDRVAFACQFLCDARLAEYVTQLIEECHATGNLCGLLLTGARAAGIALLQSYVDRHDDPQTAALVAIKFLGTEQLRDDRVVAWLENYRDLLDRWGLFFERCHMQHEIGQLANAPKPPRSIFLLCSFCGKSLTESVSAEEARQRAAAQTAGGVGGVGGGGGGANVNKTSSCPNCRKPLPRCAICLMHMGTPTAGHAAQAEGVKGATAAAVPASSVASTPVAEMATDAAAIAGAATPATGATTTTPEGVAAAVPTTPGSEAIVEAGGIGGSGGAGGGNGGGGNGNGNGGGGGAATPAGAAPVGCSGGGGADVVDGGGFRKSKTFARWFTWCQTCRHGGHAEHMREWFKRHNECPVSSCACRCYSLDLSVPRFAQT